MKDLAIKVASPYDKKSTSFNSGRTPAAEVCGMLAIGLDTDKEVNTQLTSRKTVPHWLPILEKLLEAGTDTNALFANKAKYAGQDGVRDGASLMLLLV